MDASKALIDRARERDLSVTFHRAIDEAADYFRAYRDVCSLGVDRILTSGGMATAWEGRFRLAELRERCPIRSGMTGRDCPDEPGNDVICEPSNDVIIMPGKGITGENVREIVAVTGAREVHGTRLDILESL